MSKQIFFILIFILGKINAQQIFDVFKNGEQKKFGIQFIYDGYGKLNVSKKDGNLYYVVGEQFSKDKKEYCIIRGDLKQKDAFTLKFNGEIKILTKDCCGEILKKGNFTFFSKGARKFWRLQEMDTLCDIYKCCYYLDIFK